MMTAFNLTEDQAITAITVGVDFSVSQVVNGNWGMQTIIPKVCMLCFTQTTISAVCTMLLDKCQWWHANRQSPDLHVLV